MALVKFWNQGGRNRKGCKQGNTCILYPKSKIIYKKIATAARYAPAAVVNFPFLNPKSQKPKIQISPKPKIVFLKPE